MMRLQQRSGCFLFTRFLSALLILCFGLGSVLPAYALRPMLEKAGLEEKFQPKAGKGESEKETRTRELIRQLQETQDPRIMDELLRFHQGLIRSFARRAFAKIELKSSKQRSLRGIFYGDVLDEAQSGFMDAMFDFDLNRPTGVSTYVEWKIKGRVTNLVNQRPQIHVPASISPVWLLRAYEEALSGLIAAEGPLSEAEILQAMEDWVNKDEKDPDKRKKKISSVRRIDLEKLAKARHLLKGANFYYSGQSPGDALGEWSDLWESLLELGQFPKDEEEVRSKALLERFQHLLTPLEWDVLRETVGRPLADSAKQGRQMDEGGAFVKAVAGSLNIRPEEVVAAWESATQKVRVAVERWLREGILTEEEVGPGMASELATPEKGLALLARKEDGSLAWEALLYSPGTGKTQRAPAWEYLRLLRGSPFEQDRSDFWDYMAQLTPQQRSVIEQVLKSPGATLEEIAEQMGRVKENVRQRENRSLGAAVLLAAARWYGPDSFEDLLWRYFIVSHLSLESIKKIFDRLRIRDRESFLRLSKNHLIRLKVQGLHVSWKRALIQFLEDEKQRAQRNGAGSGPAGGMEERRQRLSDLKGRVKAKQKEMGALFGKMPEDSGEFQDRKRALARIGDLSEIAAGLLKLRQTDLFDRFITELADPLLARDARTLNLILASKMGLGVKIFQRFIEEDSPRPLLEDRLEDILRGQSRWEEAGRFFYLPGLPFVVEGDNLSPEGRRKLEAAAHLIVSSGWPSLRREFLGSMESILPQENPNVGYGGLSGLHSHPKIAVGIYREASDLEMLASALIHEAKHQLNHIHPRAEAIEWFELERGVPEVRHPWLPDGSGSPKFLLDELDTYGEHTQFLLHLWETGGFQPEEHVFSVADLVYNQWLAQRAIRQLKRSEARGHLSPQAQAWLSDLEDLWKTLAPQIEVRRGQILPRALAGLLASEDPFLRWDGYLAAHHLWSADSKHRRTYQRQFVAAIRKERNLRILQEVATNNFWPASFRQIAAGRVSGIKDSSMRFFKSLFGEESPDQSGLEEMGPTLEGSLARLRAA